MAEPSDNSPRSGHKRQGLKYLDRLLPLFDRLHDVGCQRDRAGNRKLHFDHYCALILLFLLNPVLRSFRALQQASLLERVRRKVGCSRTSLGSLSEAVEILEPRRLEAIIAELWAEPPRPAAWAGGTSARCSPPSMAAWSRPWPPWPRPLTSATRTATPTAAGGSTPISRSTASCPSASRSLRRSTAARPTRSMS